MRSEVAVVIARSGQLPHEVDEAARATHIFDEFDER